MDADQSFRSQSLWKAARSRNIAVWRDLSQTWQPIPLALSPVEVDHTEWQTLVADAQLVLSCFPLLQSWLLQNPQKHWWEILYGTLTGCEAVAARANPDDSWGHATIRLDLFWHNKQLKIIEANCTIPAMQAYSDLVHSAWCEATGQEPTQHGNTDALLKSLMALYRRDGGKKKKPTLAILHRPGDSQLAELLHYEKTWATQAEVLRVTPAEVTLENECLHARDRTIDLMYRHCFGWRLDEYPVLAEAALNNRKHHIYNPLSAHYEAKAFLALLSHVANEPGWSQQVGLTTQQRQAVQDRVPWTRMIAPGQGKNQTLDLGPFHKNPESYVIKSSIGYGGHQVFMGSDWHTPETQERLKKITGATGKISTTDFVQWLQQTASDLWIIQERMTGRRHQTDVLLGDGTTMSMNAFVDASIFLNTGTPGVCTGGVSRVAPGAIVNIGGGGGLAPFVVK